MSTVQEAPPQPTPAPDDPTPAPMPQPAPDPEGQALFDRSQYDREDLAIAKVDDQQIDKIAVKFTGTVYLDRSDPADVEFFNDMRLGRDITVQIEGRCATGPVGKGEFDQDGYLKGVVGERTIKVHTVYRTAGEE